MDGSLRLISVVGSVVSLGFFLYTVLYRSWVAPGSVLGWFWEAKMGSKIDFLGVLFRMRFFIDILSIFLSIFGVIL